MNNRELASTILLAAGVAALLLSKSLRAAAMNVVRAAMSWAILRTVIALGAWVGVAVWLADGWGLWTPDLGYATVLWYFTGALGWIMKVGDAGKPVFIAGRVRDLVTIGVLLEFFVNLYVFPLWVELIAQPIIIFLVLMTAVSDSEPKLAAVGRLAGGIVGLAGLAFLGFAAWQFVAGWNSIDPWTLARQLVHPIWLTIWVIPFVYAFAVFAGYEGLLARAPFYRDDNRVPSQLIFGMAATLRLSTRRIYGLRAGDLRDVVRAVSFAEVRQAIRRSEDASARAAEAKAIARMRLNHYAGVHGRRVDGRLLDRREFAETKRALEWIATCHDGWYGRQNRFRRDLMEMLRDLTREGLPRDHGVTMRVRQDGKAWYAFRQTSTGHWFGIGATKARDFHWYFDGPEPPTGFPTRKAGWSHGGDDTRVEWLLEDEA